MMLLMLKDTRLSFFALKLKTVFLANLFKVEYVLRYRSTFSDFKNLMCEEQKICKG